jgi:hypothetical protein
MLRIMPPPAGSQAALSSYRSPEDDASRIDAVRAVTGTQRAARMLAQWPFLHSHSCPGSENIHGKGAQLAHPGGRKLRVKSFVFFRPRASQERHQQLRRSVLSPSGHPFSVQALRDWAPCTRCSMSSTARLAAAAFVGRWRAAPRWYWVLAPDRRTDGCRWPPRDWPWRSR